METRRVVITGMGAVTPLGNNVSAFWQALRDGRNGIAPITKVDVSDSPVKLAGEVRGFDPRDFMDFKAAKRMELFSQYAVAATREALLDSGLKLENEDPYRMGVKYRDPVRPERQEHGYLHSLRHRQSLHRRGI